MRRLQLQLDAGLFFLTHPGFGLKIQIKVGFDRCETVESDSPNNITLLKPGLLQMLILRDGHFAF
jgi:hypothetical protein